MRLRIISAILLLVVTSVATGCGGSPKLTLDEDSLKMMKTSLTLTTGVEITEIKTGRDGLSISYHQDREDDRTTQLLRWLDMASVAMSFMDEPHTIFIYPEVNGETASKVTIEAGDIAAFLTGEIALETAISRIKVETQ